MQSNLVKERSSWHSEPLEQAVRVAPPDVVCGFFAWQRTETLVDHPVIVWFRQDLRLSDNPALAAAAADGRPLLPVYILDDETPAGWRPGAASRWWLHGSLERLSADLSALGAPLLLLRGNAEAVLPDLLRTTGATAVYWNRCYEPYAVERDSCIKTDLKSMGVEADSFNASLLFEPWEVRSQSGGRYRAFTPFWKACLRLSEPAAPLPAPTRIRGCDGVPAGESLADWRLRPSTPDWAGGLRASWTPGEAGARRRLQEFVDGALAGYASARDVPAVDATSRLSPHLHFGEIGPRAVWHAVVHRAAEDATVAQGGATAKFLSEIGWREFSYHLLFNFPALPDRNLRTEFDGFPWHDDSAHVRAWQRGRTGYPIVDAGMRQLWHTGWMHNRVRMVVASFLIKDLLIDWRVGEAWFWDTLVDADLANNAASWQWVAGSGADAAPYFRIFNPVLQGERFDPDGAYVRRWVPELSALPNSHIHRPWTASEAMLLQSDVKLGETYPNRIVDHGMARDRALAAYKTITRGAA